MSTLTQTEQTTPSVPAAGQQRLYPKTTGWYKQNSAGVETKILDTSDPDHAAALIFLAQNYGAM